MKKEVRDRKREKLVEAAATLFHERSYAATGLADILKRAQAGSGSLYYYFENKEALALAVLDRYKALLQHVIVDPVKNRFDDPIDRVFGVLEFYEGFLADNGCTRGCPVGNLACELSDTKPAVRAKVDELFTCWKGAMRAFLEEARDRLPAGVTPDSLAVFVLSVMEGGVMQVRAARSLEPFRTSVAHLRTYFDHLLACCLRGANEEKNG